MKAISTPEEVKNGKAAAGSKEQQADCVFPAYEEAKPNEGMFPVREPGNFPEVELKHDELAKPVSFWDTVVVDFSEDAPLEEDAFDPLRDGPLRFLGYSNEVGEAFAAWLPPGGVPFTYAMAITYVLVDTYDKGLKAYRRAKRELDASADLDARVDKDKLARLLSTERAVDTVVWQLIASVAAPGYTIHTIVALTLMGLTAAESLDAVQGAAAAAAAGVGVETETFLALVNKSLPTAVGLGTIPFIVHPIDNAVHWVMNKTMRPALRKYVCKQGGGKLANLAMCDEECKSNWGEGGH